jgi:two-component system invasion response regulator UvrY
MTIKILIADDNQGIRDSLKALLSQTEIQVAAEAGTGREAVSMARDGQFDVILLDISMPDGDGFHALRQIKSERPTLAILMHSTCDEAHYVSRSRKMGASGYVIKGGDASHLVGAIRAAAKGEMLVPNSESARPQS